MQVTYALTPKDLFRAMLAHRNSTAAARWSFHIVVTIVVLFAVGGLLVVVFRPTDRVLSDVATIVAVAALWAVLMWVSPWWQARRTFAKQPLANVQQTLLLDSAGVHWRWDGGAVDLEWKYITRYFESKHQFLLYTAPHAFNTVPKRALTAEESAGFRSLLAQYAPGRAGVLEGLM